ncbi:TRAP-type uncharacterized transport system, fused permease components [Natronorubrum daqingense]|nr:TRAP-type uncharacterized transport system, fused permease components [Natronorubrum daqingense]
MLYALHPELVPLGQESVSRMTVATIVLGGVLAVYALESCRRALAADNQLEAAALGVAFGAVFLGSGYVYRNGIELVGRSELTLAGTAAALALFVVVWYSVWREIGVVPAGLVGLALAYAAVGSSLPDPIGHGGLEVDTVVLQLAIGSGVHGSFVQTTGLEIALVVLYAALVVTTGGAEVLRSAATYTSSRLGAARAWALGSALLASVSGSYLANADLLRSRSVPALSERGLRERTAAGIEAAASTVGQVLPPTVFVAGILGATLVPELTLTNVVVAGLFPAAIAVICFLVALRFVIDEADRGEDGASSQSGEGTTAPRSPEPTHARGELAICGVRFVLPIVAFVGLYYGDIAVTVSQAMVWAILLAVFLGIVVPVAQSVYRPRATEPSYHRPTTAFGTALGDTARGLRLGALVLAPVVIVVAAIGIVTELLLVTEATGLFLNASTALEAWPLALVVFAMIVAALGTPGLPTAVGTAFVGSLVVVGGGQEPTDLSPFFVTLYVVAGAALLPPVAVAAARTARTDTVETWAVSSVALRLLAPLYVLPFAFVSRPELVSPSPTLESLSVGLLTLVGGLAVVYASNAPIPLSRGTRWLARGVVGTLGAAAMVAPTTTLQLLFAPAAVVAVAVVRRR